VRLFTVLSLLTTGFLAGCSDAAHVDTPVTGRFAWFAFLGGEDIRADCRPGAPARYRFVYNAVFDEQVRSYDLTRKADGATLDVRVPPAGATAVKLQAFADGSGPRTRATATLDLDTYRAIARQLEADGFGGATPTDRNFPSWDFYWMVSACAEGRFHIYAWRNGTPEFAALRFPALLFAQDKTGAPVNPVRSNTYADYTDSKRMGMPDLNFDVRLAPDGLANRMRLF
jgi:hypothetical protein